MTPEQRTDYPGAIPWNETHTTEHVGNGSICTACDELWPCKSMLQAELARLTADGAALREQLAESRAREHVLVIVGDKLSRHLEWIIGEPNSGFVPEVLDAIKASSQEDVAHWLNSIQQFGFKRPEEMAQAPAAGASSGGAEDGK